MALVLPPKPRDGRGRRHEHRLLDTDAHLLALNQKVSAIALRLGDVFGGRPDERPLDLLVAEDHEVKRPRGRLRVRHDLGRQDERFLAGEYAGAGYQAKPEHETQ